MKYTVSANEMVPPETRPSGGGKGIKELMFTLLLKLW